MRSANVNPEEPSNNPIPLRKAARACLLFGFVMALHSCREEPQLWLPDSLHQVMRDYIETRPEQFSEFGKLAEVTGMRSLLNTRGPYTLFLPTNEAMLDYYTQKNVGSLDGFSESELRDLFFNHIVAFAISSFDIGLGTLSEKNALGDYLVTEFRGSDIIISKNARIIDRDIQVSNGYIHVVDRTLEPVTRDIYTVVSSDPSYAIFAQGLALTGLKDTLALISFPYGSVTARTRFTLLAVGDTIFHHYGIRSVDDLVEWCDADPDSVTFPDNPFYRFMEYHCLMGSHYLSDLNTGAYPVLSRENNISVTIDNEDYKINLDKTTGEYTGFNIPASNTPAKNGVIHAIDDILPVTEPEPTRVLFETTDFLELTVHDFYLHNYMRWHDGQNTFENIKWEGDFLLYWYRPDAWDNPIHLDCLSMTGWFTISITFPKVMKGKYELWIGMPRMGSIPDCKVYIDGEFTDALYRGIYGTGEGGSQKVGEVDFKTTTEHTITIRNTRDGQLFWDFVAFEPLVE
jgi:uncharacterized surface protein with fasciclin (FAS1) repeats